MCVECKHDQKEIAKLQAFRNDRFVFFSSLVSNSTCDFSLICSYLFFLLAER